MGLTFIELSRELIQMVPFLSPTMAERFINRAYRDVRDAREWSFLYGEGALFAPQAVSDGAVTVTQFSQTITFNAAAQAVLDVLANPVVTQRQFRTGSGGGPIYSIIEYAAGVATLDRMYLEASATDTSYSIFRQLYFPTSGTGAQITDFQRFISIIDPIQGWRLRMNYTVEELDSVDPMRSSAGQPVLLASHFADDSGNPLYELWPTATTGSGYPFVYRKQGTDLSAATDTLPNILPDQLILERAKYHAYEWAEAHKGSQPTLRGTDWKYLMSLIDTNDPHHPRGTYQELLQRARLADDNRFMRQYRSARSGRYWRLAPIDGNFMQSHDPNFYL